MINQIVKGFMITSVMIFYGCASSQPTKTSRKPCGSFCYEIAACAKVSGHEKHKDLLCNIAKCETGNKCRAKINSPTGKYKGPFQFSRPTWRSQCYPVFNKKHLPQCKNEKAMQDTCCSTTCAAELIENDGLHNWPTCGKKSLELNSSKP